MAHGISNTAGFAARARPPLVWPSLGPTLAKYYVRTEKDALFVDFEGASSAEQVSSKVVKGLDSGMPLVVVNVLPEQERGETPAPSVASAGGLWCVASRSCRTSAFTASNSA